MSENADWPQSLASGKCAAAKLVCTPMPCYTASRINDWALITGASEGIGRELAKLFAKDKFNLVLVARNETRLNQFADELRAKHGIEIKVLAKDLVSPTAPQEIFDALRDTPISILVNNAGVGWHDPFA